MSFKAEYLEALFARVDIVVVLSRFIPLRRRKNNLSEYHCRCPFHSERHASFTVSSTKQFFHCFGCGANGGAVQFLQAYCGFSFQKAVFYLAELCHFYPRQWRALEKKKVGNGRKE